MWMLPHVKRWSKLLISIFDRIESTFFSQKSLALKIWKSNFNDLWKNTYGLLRAVAFKCATKICSMSPKEHSVLAKQDYKDFSENYESEAQSVGWSWLQIFKNLIELP